MMNSLSSFLARMIPNQSGDRDNKEQQALTKKAFISYSTLDRADAFLLKHLLEKNGITVWLDVFDIRVTGKIQSDLLNIINQQDLFCLLLSPKSVESKWVKEEISVAKRASALRILPIILRPCDIPTELQETIGFDAREGLAQEAVQVRLMKHIVGKSDFDGLVIFDMTQRELQHDQFLRNQAAKDVVDVEKTVSSLSKDPIRHLTINISPLSLPEDPNNILELKLDFKGLWKGTMSFFFTRYREGLTWPEGYEQFREPEFSEFYLKRVPRFDAQFQWFDRVVRLNRVLNTGVTEDQKVIFGLDFDGKEFQPKQNMAMSQVFEIASLETLVKDGSKFELLVHNTSNGANQVVPEETDIDIEVVGKVQETGWITLYRSRTSREQRNLLGIPELSAAGINPILRAALLAGCWKLSPKPQATTYTYMQQAIATAIRTNKYDTEDERRLCSYSLFQDAGTHRFHARWRDAHAAFDKSRELLWPIVQSSPEPSIQDATTIFVSILQMSELFQRQKSWSMAETIAGMLLNCAKCLVESAVQEPDFQRMWADAHFIKARINAQTEKDQVTESLTTYTETYHKLYLGLNSPARRVSYITALHNSIQNIQKWAIQDISTPLETWSAALREEVNDSRISDQLLQPPRPPDCLPSWLTPQTLTAWPTKPLTSIALRVTLRIPQRFSTDSKITGTSQLIDQHFQGTAGCDAEWLRLSFMGNAADNIEGLVDAPIALCGMPLLLDLEPMPTMVPGSWVSFGRIPSLMTNLSVDDAIGYMGVAKYNAESALFGRMYVLVMRRRRFVWKVALSFMTTCLPGTTGAVLERNDHIRAGAMLGYLELDMVKG